MLATVFDAGPTLSQHWFNISLLVCCRHNITPAHFTEQTGDIVPLLVYAGPLSATLARH